MDLNFLKNMTFLNIIEDLEEKYFHSYGEGTLPFNISFWDPSEKIKQQYLKLMEFQNITEIINYNYSYQVDDDIRKLTLKKLGINPDLKTLLFTPSGTISILVLIEWIKAKKYDKIAVLCPSYFSIVKNLSKDNIPFDIIYFKRSMNGYHVPFKNLNQYKVIWITNPVYSTSVHLNTDDICRLKRLLDNGIVIVADESLASNGKELSRKLGNHFNFFGIYSPHKTISVNGFKFSLITFHENYDDDFDKLTDLIFGSLTSSNIG